MLITIFTYIYTCLFCFVEMSSGLQATSSFEGDYQRRKTENRKTAAYSAAFIHEQSFIAAPTLRLAYAALRRRGTPACASRTPSSVDVYALRRCRGSYTQLRRRLRAWAAVLVW